MPTAMGFLLAVTALCAVMASGHCTTFTDDFIRAKIDEFIEAGMACQNKTALSLAIVRGGEVFMAKGYGTKTEGGTDPVTADTKFGIGSVSKSFTVAALAKVLNENGKDILTSWILENRDVFDSNPRRKYTTGRDLVSHAMGVQKYNQMRYSVNDRSEIIATIKKLRTRGTWRASSTYNNLINGLAAVVTEMESGMKWEDYVTQALLTPLGMDNTTFTTAANPYHPDMAQGYTVHNNVQSPVSPEYSKKWGESSCGSGNMLTSARDMTKWMRFHLGKGNFPEGQTVLDKDLLAKLHIPQNNLPRSRVLYYYFRPDYPVTMSHHSYAMGWRVGHYDGFRMLQHSGTTPGFLTLCTMYPDLDLGVYVSMPGRDKHYLFRQNLNAYITDLMVHQTPWLSTETVCTFPAPWAPSLDPVIGFKVDPATPPTHPIDSYVGNYKHEPYNLEITKQTEHSLQLKYGWGSWDLHPYKTVPDQFYIVGTGDLKYAQNFSYALFDVSSSGEVGSTKLPWGSYDAVTQFDKVPEN